MSLANVIAEVKEKHLYPIEETNSKNCEHIVKSTLMMRKTSQKSNSRKNKKTKEIIDYCCSILKLFCDFPSTYIKWRRFIYSTRNSHYIVFDLQSIGPMVKMSEKRVDLYKYTDTNRLIMRQG